MDNNIQDAKRFRRLSLLVGLAFTIFVLLIFWYEEQRRQNTLLHNNGTEFLWHHSNSFMIYHDNLSDLLFAIHSNEIFNTFIKDPSDINRFRLNSLFKAIAEGERSVSKVRYIDQHGMEVIRVDRDSKTLKVHSFNQNELSDKSNRYYFKETIKLPAQQYFHSRFDLNVEHGKIEQPLNPVWRLALPVEQDGKRKGMLIINFFTQPILTEILESSLFKVYLYDQDNYILASNDPDQPSWTRYIGTSETFDTSRFFMQKKLSTAYGDEELSIGIIPNYDTLSSLSGQQNILLLFLLLSIASLVVAKLLTHALVKQYVQLHQYITLMKNGAHLAKLGYLQVDFLNKTLQLDPSIQYLLQFPDSEETTKTISIEAFKERYIPKEEHHIIDNELREVFRLHKNYSHAMEHRVILPDGTFIHVIQRYHVEYDRSGNPTTGYSVLQNVTKAHERELLLHAALDAAESANRSKSDFLANMSHEIRTPMHAVLGLVDQILKRVTDPSITHKLTIIKTSGKALVGIINDILDFSKLEGGKMSIERQPCRFKALMEENLLLFDEELKKKSITLDITFSQTLPACLLLDSARLRQIFTNLLGNAIKFTPNEGRINIEVNYNTSKKVLSFSVSDTGIGISSDQIEKIFQPFEQEDTSTTRKYGGTGLGLAISSRLVEAMQGTIEVKSKPGKGSCFLVHIPSEECADSPDEETTSASKTELDPLSQKKVLIVEDNKTNQLLMQLILDEAGIDYDIANDGNEAIEIYHKASYDAILMDENMPEKNGIEATQEIREIERKHNRSATPIIAVTANALSEDETRFLRAGMNDYISKPYNEEQLMRILKKHL